MKDILLFLLLISLIFCQPPNEFNNEEKIKRRKKLQTQMVDCILKSDLVSDELKNQIEDNKDGDLRKIFHLYISQLYSNDKEIIKKCRRDLFLKIRGVYRNNFEKKYNISLPFHLRGGNIP